MKKVNVVVIFEGIESPAEKGVLIGDKILLAEGGEIGIYDAIPTKNPDKFIVNLDARPKDYLANNTGLLIEFLTA
jgi:hypothetical protein